MGQVINTFRFVFRHMNVRGCCILLGGANMYFTTAVQHDLGSKWWLLKGISAFAYVHYTVSDGHLAFLQYFHRMAMLWKGLGDVMVSGPAITKTDVCLIVNIQELALGICASHKNRCENSAVQTTGCQP